MLCDPIPVVPETFYVLGQVDGLPEGLQTDVPPCEWEIDLRRSTVCR